MKWVFFMFEQTVRFVSLVCIGLAAGIALCVFFLERVGTDSGQFYTQLAQMQIRALKVPAPAIGALGLVAMITHSILLYIGNGGTQLWLLAAAVLLSLAALALTKFGHFPINDQLLRWDAMHPPAHWRTVQSRWSALHLGRTSCASASFALLVLSNLLRR